MPGLRIELSGPEAVQRFRDVAHALLEWEKGELSTELKQRLAAKARDLGVHPLDRDAVLAEVAALPAIQALRRLPEQDLEKLAEQAKQGDATALAKLLLQQAEGSPEPWLVIQRGRRLVFGKVFETSDRPTPGRVTQREATPGAAGSSPAAPATIADRYRVVATLSARGGEATVYRCQDLRRSAQDVAVKLYHTGWQPKDEALQPLLRLRSRHVVSLLECSQWQGQFYEVQEYCAGGSLLANAPYAEDRLRAMLEQILAGLHHCHQQNLVHCDLKPSNLLFRDAAKQEVVVADFGISSVLDSLARDDAESLEPITRRSRDFTLDYTAPELFGAEEVVSPKVDYYALGITLAHLRQNCSPFHGFHPAAIMAAHVRGAIPWPAGLSAAFQTLLTGLSQTDPANRWGYRQVGQWLRGEAIQNDRGQPWHPIAAA